MAPTSRLLLVGMMGAGKTTVGGMVARRLGWPLLDSDSLVESDTGHTVPEIFAEQGEPAFRAAESRALRRSLAGVGPAVVAVAGGAVLDAANRDLLRASGTVVWLRARPQTLASRVGTGAGRPLLEEDPARSLAALDEVRRPLYSQLADHVVDVDGRRPEEVADAVLALLEPGGPAPDAGRDGTDRVGPGGDRGPRGAGHPVDHGPAGGVATVRVALGDRGYDVLIGRGVRDRLASVVRSRLGRDVHRAAIVTQAEVAAAGWLDRLDPGVPCGVHLMPEGEGAKSLATVERLCREFAQAGLARTDVVVAVGGGLVTDVAGFAAAAYQRGTAYVNVATTLLAQVDAAIGGKTAVNLPEGKNLVGAFWQPIGVLCDTATLSTLPEREWACGRGEMAKYALLGPGGGDAFLGLPVEEQVAWCVARKARVVAGDEREGGPRMVLNYGHTLAHALEAAAFVGPGTEPGRWDLRHGEAVAVGLVFAALLARRLGRVDDERVALHRRVVAGLGLSAQLPPGMDPSSLLVLMARDKKARHDLTFVLDGPRGVEVVHGVAEDEVLATLAEMGSGL